MSTSEGFDTSLPFSWQRDVETCPNSDLHLAESKPENVQSNAMMPLTHGSNDVVTLLDDRFRPTDQTHQGTLGPHLRLNNQTKPCSTNHIRLLTKEYPRRLFHREAERSKPPNNTRQTQPNARESSRWKRRTARPRDRTLCTRSQHSAPSKDEWERILRPIVKDLYNDKKLPLNSVVFFFEHHHEYRIT